jgi:hypothetical protein
MMARERTAYFISDREARGPYRPCWSLSRDLTGRGRRNLWAGTRLAVRVRPPAAYLGSYRSIQRSSQKRWSAHLVSRCYRRVTRTSI